MDFDKRLADLDGRRFQYTVAGAGRPPILLINGGGGPIEGWFRVFRPLSALSTVFAYNRAGIGKSDRPTEPQTADVVVRDLRALLATLSLTPPYVVVGHSLGGLFANLLARRHPHEVAGVVLLEASAPDDIALMKSGEGAFQRVIRRALDSVFGKDQFGEPDHAETSARQVAGAGPFPDIPLAIVTGGKPAMAFLTPAHQRQGRAANQAALAALSPRGQQVIAARSGHFPQFSEPDVVVGAIEDVWRAAAALAR